MFSQYSYGVSCLNIEKKFSDFFIFIISIKINIFRQPPLRAQIQQPLNAEMLSQQQQQHQQGMKQNMSPKRDGRTLLSQNIIHQTYGVAQQQSSGVSGVGIVGNSAVIGSGNIISGAIPVSSSNIAMIPGGMARQRPPVNMSSVGANININPNMVPPHLPMAYYAQSASQQSYYGEVLHPMQVSICFDKFFKFPEITNIKKKNLIANNFHSQYNQNHVFHLQLVFNDWHLKFNDNCVRHKSLLKILVHHYMQLDMAVQDHLDHSKEQIEDPP